MAITVIVGAQYGDEGKGKMSDYLAKDADFVARFQGGDNAGHTVLNQYGVFKMHLVPCGVFTPGVINFIGTGTAVNPDVLIEELDTLNDVGIDTSELYLSERAQLVLPYHVQLDEQMEARSSGIGTTKRGIGQAYAFKLLRKNPRAGDLRDIDEFERILGEANDIGIPGIDFAIPRSTLERWAERLVPILREPLSLVHGQIAAGKNLLFEGQLGVMKDIDQGIYPFVTSSHTTASYAAVSAGFPARLITDVIGVAKAFESAVGKGHFPTEMGEDEAAPLRGTGENPDDEYGARTGRSRRLGWLDMEVLRFAHKINGFDALALTKLDKLDALAEIKVCTHYASGTSEPVYRAFPGWLSDTTKCKTFDALPTEAQAYVRFIEAELNVPVRWIGNGPVRDDVIAR